MYYQIGLQREDSPRGVVDRVCWVEQQGKRVKVGDRITLKEDDPHQWVVVNVYQTTLAAPPDKTWEVGGL